MFICGFKPKARRENIPALKAESAEAKIPPKYSLRQSSSKRTPKLNIKRKLPWPILHLQCTGVAKPLDLKGKYTTMTIQFGQLNVKNMACLIIKVSLIISLQFKATDDRTHLALFKSQGWLEFWAWGKIPYLLAHMLHWNRSYGCCSNYFFTERLM